MWFILGYTILYVLFGSMCLYVVFRMFYSYGERKKVFDEWLRSHFLMKATTILLAPFIILAFVSVAVSGAILSIGMDAIDSIRK